MVRKLLLIFILIVLCNRVQNSTEVPVLIVSTEPEVAPIEKLIYAIGMVEATLDTLAYNPEEKATGYFQIRPIRLADYNKRTGKNYKLEDMYDFDVAKEVFMYYADLIGHDDFETIAKRWNGSGSMTIKYWEKVKSYL